jgi:hypothetical protein
MTILPADGLGDALVEHNAQFKAYIDSKPLEVILRWVKDQLA